jgi:hypothetical protein
MTNMERNRQFDAHLHGSNSARLDSCANSGSPGTISSQPDTKVINETIERPQISITLGVTPMEGKCLICPLVTGYGHQQINAVRSITVFT